jgi:putative effector of murein hydrolase LrgA (UPF0299 family)
MIAILALLLSCQLAGEILARSLALPMPGPVVGLILLAVVLLVWVQRRPDLKGTLLDKVTTFLVGGLGLLFVPTGVGVVQQLGLLGDYGVGIVLTLIISAVLTMLATVGAFLLVKRWTGRRP